MAGEDAGGAHGSNRLGGNGVANSTVYGGVAGDVMATDVISMGALREPDESVLDSELERARQPLERKPGSVLPLRKALQDAMWEDAGVVRTETGLTRCLDRIKEISDRMHAVGVDADDLAFNLTWHGWLDLANLCEISEVIVRAALARDNSQGAHFREDHPQPGALDESDFTVVRKSGEGLEVGRKPVQFTIVRPGETILPAGEPETLVTM